MYKIFFFSFIVFFNSVISAIGQEKSLEDYSLRFVPSIHNSGRAYICIFQGETLRDSIMNTYYSAKPIESYFIKSPTEVAFINKSYKHFKQNENGVWDVIESFQLMRNSYTNSWKMPNSSCTRWKLEGMTSLFRSDTKTCSEDPIWVKQDFQAERQKVQQLKMGTPEFDIQLEEIKKRSSKSKN